MGETIRVRVPATTANLGPGFDCLGMALDLWNTIEVTAGKEGFSIYGEGSNSLSHGKRNLVFKSLSAVFGKAGLPVPRLSLVCTNEIPLSRGLGSSSAAIVGGLVAGNELCGRMLDQDSLLSLAVEIEGHPDNVTPALLGGLQIVVNDEGRLITQEVPFPQNLKAVLFIPDVPMPTHQARRILSPTVTREDAVYNIGRVALLIAAVATGGLQGLHVATQDRLHQPARQSIFPPMASIIEQAMEAGALGAFLSGGGSTILALAKESQDKIGEAMQDGARLHNVQGATKVVSISPQGAHVAFCREHGTWP